MFITLTTDSLRGYGLNRIFAFAKELGFDGIDLAVDTKIWDTQNSTYVKSLIDEYKMPVLSISTPANTTPKHIEEAVAMAKVIGTKMIVVQPPKLLNFRYTQWLKNEIPKIRKRENISIALENAPADTFLGIIPEHAMNNINELKKFKHAAIDTSRIAEKKEDLLRVYNALNKYLVLIHLSNVSRGKSYCTPEEGILPIESLLTKLNQEGFAGVISFKVDPKKIMVGKDDKMKEKLTHAKKYCEKYLGKV